MGMPDVALRIHANMPVRIDGRAFTAGPVGEDGRVFTEKATGHEIPLTNANQLRMARAFRLTSEGDFQALDDNVKEALQTDWGSFTVAERTTAEQKQLYCAGVDKLPARDRHRKAAIQAVIDAVGEEHGIDVGLRPSPRMVRHWDRLWLCSGRDIRALVPFTWKKGNRRARLQKWMVEEIDRAIDETYATQPSGSEADARRRAQTRIRERALREGLTIPDLGQKDVIGKNVIARALKHREQYDLIEKRCGKREADRLLAAVGTGPQGDWPLAEVEADHTLLDIIVIDPVTKKSLGRPWLTALIDRFSRCIIGWAIGFHPPSWTSVMEALQHAVMPKDDFVAALGGIHEEHPCHGCPDRLFTDGGRELLGSSMRALEAALNMKVVPLPRRRGDLKGKIERWFRTLEEQVIHVIAGTTLSNVLLRKEYDAEGLAVLTLAQLRWVVAKWIIDVYHQENHSATGGAPAERWRRGLSLCGQKLPPPRELLAPLTGIADRRVLTREGIRYKGLRWNSNAFSRLRNRIGLDAEVDIRIDPLDLTRAWAHDPKSRTWLAGDLMTEDVEVGETLHQYEVITKRARETREPTESKRASVARARSEIFEFVRTIVEGNTRSKAPKKFARFRADGRKPMEHLAPERASPAESDGRRPGHLHDLDRPPRARHTAAGPYRRAKPSPDPVVDPPPIEPTADPGPSSVPVRVQDPDTHPAERSAPAAPSEPEGRSDPPPPLEPPALAPTDTSGATPTPPSTPPPDPPPNRPPTTLRRREI
ncbi:MULTISPECIES: Mu transposase C-terminal domain-containing protein [unclassified Methylobacterium]|uniref:Mu transposase C-terminal domain-containing protein n=1 Tax=unclassified Methylobacterium TaxID=2615210 RepID=UPI003700F424